MWYKEALRKHTLRVDLHTHIGEMTDFSNPNDLTSALRSLLAAAVYKGLDVIGVVSHVGPYVGQEAQRLIKTEGIDLYVLAGEEYFSVDKIRMIIYNLQEPLPQNQTADKIIEYAHQQKGFVLIINASKRAMQQLNKIEGTSAAPDAVEVYNASSGGYRDTETNYPTFVSSAAKSSAEMDKLNIFTLIDRKDIESIGLLPENYGTEYVPQYLLNQNAHEQQQQQQQPQEVAQNGF